MIQPQVMEELIAHGISIEIGPSDMYNNYQIVLRKRVEHRENSLIQGTIQYSQFLPNDRIGDIDRNTECVKFMLQKVFEANTKEIEKEQLLKAKEESTCITSTN